MVSFMSLQHQQDEDEWQRAQAKRNPEPTTLAVYEPSWATQNLVHVLLNGRPRWAFHDEVVEWVESGRSLVLPSPTNGPIVWELAGEYWTFERPSRGDAWIGRHQKTDVGAGGRIELVLHEYTPSRVGQQALSKYARFELNETDAIAMWGAFHRDFK